MLRDDRTATYRQLSYMFAGALPPGELDLHIPVLGRLTGKGNFGMEYVAQQFAVHAVKSGAGRLESDGNLFPVKAGSIFVLFPGRHVRYYELPESPWRYTYFRLDGRCAAWALACAGLTPQQPALDGGYDALLEPYFREMEEAYSQDSCPPVFPLAAAWKIAQALVEAGPDQKRNFNHNIAGATRTFLDHEYRNCPTMDKLAKHLGVTRFTIFRRFREAFGLSPKQYLDNIRLDQARLMLRQSRASVKEIAIACGFADAHYFSRAFRLRFKASPCQWRAGQSG